MGLYNHWKDFSLTAWQFDDVNELRNIQGQAAYDNAIENYRTEYWSNISQLFFSMGMKFNLGGNEEKSRLETTSRPIGVFDFGLASKGLYRVQEYFSKKLQDEKPKRFEEFGLASGIVPPNFVNNIATSNGKIFVFKDIDGKEYVCEKQQKGTAGIDQKIKDSKLKFATNTKKVYLKFKRKGGKVKNVEIYSLFYFDSLSGNEQYAIRHLPAMMVAEYFESIGIKVRFYMVRFVELYDNKSDLTIRKNDIKTNDILPMYSESLNIRNFKKRECLAVCPFLVKDFAQDIDWVQALNVSQTMDKSTYVSLINYTLNQDYSYTNTGIYGQPNFSNLKYREGFERFKNKYQLYTKNGIWKSKELTTDSQLLFHSMSIKNLLYNFEDELRTTVFMGIYSLKLIFEQTTVGKVFFEWWMKISATNLKDLVLLQISSELKKDLKKIIDENMKLNDDLHSYLTISAPIVYANNQIELQVIELCKRYVCKILKWEGYFQQYIYDAEGNGTELFYTFNDFKNANYNTYIEYLMDESTIFAEKGFFPTPKEDIEKREERQTLIKNELNAI